MMAFLWDRLDAIDFTWRGLKRQDFSFTAHRGAFTIALTSDFHGVDFPWLCDADGFPLFTEQGQPADGFSVIGGAYQKGSRSAQILKPRGPKVLGIREEVDHARITLHHALIENRRESQVLSPDAHTHHEIEVGCIFVPSADLPHAIVGHPVRQAAVANFALEPLE